MIHRPEWKRELDPELYIAIKKGSLPSVVDMNRAFSRADSAVDVTVAYYAASEMVAFAVERFGFPGIDRALALWGDGVRTADVLDRAFGIGVSAFDSQFRSWSLARLSRYESQYVFDVPTASIEDATKHTASDPKNPEAHVELAVALLRSRRGDDADREVRQALAIDPACKNALFVAAKIAAGSGRMDDAAKQIATLHSQGSDGYAIEMALAELAERGQDASGRRRALEAAATFDPSQVDPQRALYAIAHADHRSDDEIRALTEVAKLDQHDRGSYGKLLETLVSLKRWQDARALGQAALYVDVENRDTHANLARALSATGDHVQASFELGSALLCDGQPSDKAALHVLLARERASLGDLGGARAHRDQALVLDPKNSEARALGF